jgi:hypothetical protein
VDWAKSSKKRRSKGARKAHGRKARREAESRRDEKKERPNHDELMATRKFFDATAMGKQTNSSSAFRSKKIGAKQAKALEQIAKLGERQQKAWAAIVYKGPGIPRLDENFKKAMKETQAIEQELLQIASSGEIGKNLMIRKKINLPRRGRGGKKGKPEKFPIRDQAHLDVVETSFKHRASKLDVKQRDALLGELTKYVTAAGRLLAYKDLVVEVKKEEQHDKSIEQEFGKRYSKTLKQIQLKKEGEEGKQRRESRQKKYTAVRVQRLLNPS